MAMSERTIKSRRKSRALAQSAVAISKQTSDINVLKLALEELKALAANHETRNKELAARVTELEEENRLLRLQTTKPAPKK